MPAIAAHVQIDRIAAEHNWQRSVDPEHPRIIRYLNPMGHTIIRVHLDGNGYLYNAVKFEPRKNPKYFGGYRPRIVERLRVEFEPPEREGWVC
jgi:hypothetical protein